MIPLTPTLAHVTPAPVLGALAVLLAIAAAPFVLLALGAGLLGAMLPSEGE